MFVKWFRGLLLFVFALSASAASPAQDSAAMFSEYALKNCDFSLIAKEIAAVQKECDIVFEQTEALIEKIKKEDSADTRAVSRRFEIAKRLKANMESLRNGDAGQQILAWQAAKEMQVLLAYFRAEAARVEKRSARPAAVEYSVKDFGAVGDGKNDDGPAFRKAFEAVKKAAGKPVVLHVPAGTYRISPDPAPLPKTLALRMADGDGRVNERTGKLARTHLLLTNTDFFTLSGEKGTRLLFTDSTMLGIRLLGCSESALRNIIIDYADNPSSQGRVVKVEENPRAMIFNVDPGFPAPDSPRFVNAPSRRFTMRYPGKPQLYGQSTGRLGKVERIDDKTFRIFPLPHEVNHHAWQRLKAGMKLSIIARYDPTRYDASAVDLRFCRFCRLDNVTVYKSPGVAFRLFRNYALILSGCRIEPAPGVPDYVSSNADGSQCSGAIGPYVEKVYFSNMEDDAFNFNSPSPELTDVSADRLRSSPFASRGAFLVSGVTGEIKAVLQTSPESPKKYLVPLPSNYITNARLKSMTAEEKLRMDFFGANAGKYKNRPDRLIMMPSDLSGTVVVDSEFYNIRGLALQITAPNVLVENCKIRNMNGFGINVNAMLPWGMCFNPHNVVLRNCLFEDNLAPAICLQYRGLNSQEVPVPRNIQGIRVENCTFKQKAWCAVEIKNAENVVLTGNRFVTVNPDWKTIYCDNFRNLAVSDCTFNVVDKAQAIYCKNQQEAGLVKQNNNVVSLSEKR